MGDSCSNTSKVVHSTTVPNTETDSWTEPQWTILSDLWIPLAPFLWNNRTAHIVLPPSVYLLCAQGKTSPSM